MYRDDFREEEQQQDVQLLVKQYEEMLNEGGIGFFEKHEFTKLLDYYEIEQNTHKALEVIEHARVQHPFTATFLVRKAQFLMDENREPEALELLEQAEHFDASEMDIYLFRAEILASYGRFDDALASLEYAKIRISQSDIDELHLAYASVYEHQEDFDKMFNSLQDALLADPDNEDALDRIWLCVELGNKYQESLSLHNHILDLNAYNYMAWFNLGHAYLGLSSNEKAAEAYEFAFTIKEDFEIAYNYCAEAYAETELYEDAIRVYKEALTVFPQNFEFHMHLGSCHEAQNQFRLARNCYIKAARINEKSAKAYFCLGECYAQEERWIHALSAYQSAVKIEDRNPEYLAAVAEAHYQLDDNEKADELFKEAIILDTSNTEIWVQYISFLIALDSYEMAYEAVEVAEEYCEALEVQCCKITVFYLHNHRKEALNMLQIMLLSDIGTADMLLDLFPDLKEEIPIMNLIGSLQ